MNLTFDRVGNCPEIATVVVEAYSAANGCAHGSLDASVYTCADCHITVRSQITSCSMTPYTLRLGQTERLCGSRSLYQESRYSQTFTPAPQDRKEAA